MTVLKNCRLMKELSSVAETGLVDIVIENGIISEILKVGEKEYDDANVINCAGKTLMPGLIDLHTHITVLGNVGNHCLDDPMELLVEASKQASKYLDYGFTTIRDCGSYSRVANYVAKMSANGQITAPRIIACGKTLAPSITVNEMSEKGINNFSDGAEEYRKHVREEVAYGADFIKIYSSGSAFSRSGTPKHPTMTSDEIKTAVETAEANGIYVASHCHADRAIRTCLESGVRTIEHATYIEEETLELLYSLPDAYLVPTFSAMYVSQTDPEDRAFWLDRLNPMLTQCSKGMEAAYRYGEKLGFGTDSAPGSPQYENGVEFQMRKTNCHMENVDILLQATRNNAEIAKLDRLGEIKEGYIADLILVDGNPDEDMSVMYHKPLKVWKDGVLVREQN